MVQLNRGFPESPNENLPPLGEVIMADSEEEDEESALDGYQPLPTNEEDTQDLLAPASPLQDNLPPIIPMEDVLVREVWSAPAPKFVDIEMDSKKVDEVKQAMLNITLPPGAIPEWANNIPEEQWREKLFSQLEKLDKK